MGVIAIQRPDDPMRPASSIGRPANGVQIYVADEFGAEVPVDTQGNLLVKTSTMFRGYYKHADATRAAFRDGWYITGDIAYRDELGYVHLVGRHATFINVGGKKVNIAEVEQVLQEHEMVREAVVFSVDADASGELIHAAVVLKGAVAVNDIVAFCRRRLAAYKVPSHIVIVEELPKTTLGKVRRNMAGGLRGGPQALL
jgi:long-chain acyl-CoA synthetase